MSLNRQRTALPLVAIITGDPNEGKWVLSGSVHPAMHALMKTGTVRIPVPLTTCAGYS